jgi:glycerate dehydrogenase
MKGVFLDFATMGPGLDLTPLELLVDELRIRDHSAERDLPEAIADAELVFTNKMRLGRSLLTDLPRLRFIGLTATGTDNVDLEAARELGIAVANIRAYCTRSVVEHVFGVLLLLTHRLAAYRASVAAGRWQDSDTPFLLDHPITELAGKTLGIVGYGELGQGVAAMGKAFGMRVDIAARPGTAEIPAGRRPFADVLARADVVSLHCPLNDTTRKLFAAEAFARMKPSAILVNTARGGLVDSGALVSALKTGAIAGAAIDVLPTEPPVDGDPLLDYTGENLVVTPHVAWASDQARQNAIDELAANVQAFIAGKTRNRII